MHRLLGSLLLLALVTALAPSPAIAAQPSSPDIVQTQVTSLSEPVIIESVDSLSPQPADTERYGLLEVPKI